MVKRPYEVCISHQFNWFLQPFDEWVQTVKKKSILQNRSSKRKIGRLIFFLFFPDSVWESHWWRPRRQIEKKRNKLCGRCLRWWIGLNDCGKNELKIRSSKESTIFFFWGKENRRGKKRVWSEKEKKSSEREEKG